MSYEYFSFHLSDDDVIGMLTDVCELRTLFSGSVPSNMKINKIGIARAVSFYIIYWSCA